jgi:hypothetical protein
VRSIRVGVGIDRVIVVIVLGDHDPLDSSQLLFKVMDDCLLLLPSEGDGTLTCPGLVQGLTCSSHDGDESLLLSVHGSHGLSHDRDVVLLPLSDGRGGLLLIDGEVEGVARHGREDGGGRRRTVGLGQRRAKVKKTSIALITILECLILAIQP